MSQALANRIRRQLTELTHAYKQRLIAIAGEYERLAPEELTRQARHDLDLVAQALETENSSPFLAAIRERTAERMAADFDVHSTERLLQALAAIEDTLFPYIDDVQDAHFVWRMMRQARAFIAIMPMQKLYDSELKFRQLVDRSPVGIFRTTPEGQIIEANPAFLRIVGYDSLTAINKIGVPGLYQNSDDREHILALLQQGAVSGYETHFRRADGQTVPVSIAARMMDEDKEQYLEGIIEDITERKWALEALRESEERLRIISDSMQVGIVVIDAQTHVIIDANPAAVEMIGATREQIVGSLCHKYICPAEEGQCPVTDLKQRVDNSERVLLQANGNSIPILKAVAPIVLDGRECLLESFIDISERKQVEAALRESEERFRSVVENSHTGVLIVNETFQFIYANDQTCQILGYPREDLIGMDFRQVLDDESKQTVADRYVRRQRGEQVPPRYELGIVQKDGQKRQLEMSAVVLKDPDGSVRTVAQVLDITERKRAEAALRENEQRYRQLIEEASDVVYTTDAEGYVTYINSPGSKLSGYSRDQMIGMHFTEMLPKGWKEQVLSFYQQQFRDGTRETTLEFPFITKDGEQKWVEQTATLLIRDGSPAGFQSIVRDITERKHLEQEIRESLERRGRQVQTSIEVAQDIAAATALDELFGRVVTLIKQRFGYYHVQIFRYEPQVNAVELVVGYGETGAEMLAAGHRLRMGHGVVGAAAATGRSVLASDVTQDPDWVPNPFLPETKGELAVPIVFRQTQDGKSHDQVLGILDVQSDVAGTLTPEDQFLLDGLCGQIAIAIESTRLRQEMEDRLRELDALYRTTARKGWKTAQLDTPAYMFDSQTGLSAVPDLWMPPIEEALESGTQAQQEDVVVLPLLLRGEAIGAVGVYDDPQAPLSPGQLAFLQSLTEQATQALESARLFEEARTSAEELSILNEMSRTLSTLLDVEAVFESVYHHTSRLMDTSSFYIALYDAETEEISFPLAVEDQQRVQWRSRRLGKGLTEHVISSREPVLISENIFQWLEQQGIEAIGREAQSWLGVPMTAGDRVLGVIAVQSYTSRRLYDEHHRDLLSAVAGQAAIAIQTTRLFQETRSRAEELSVLNDLSQALSATLNVQQVLEETYRGVSRLLDTTNFYIGLYDPHKGEVVFPLNVTESKIDQEITIIPADQGVTGHIVHHRASVLIEENVNEWLKEAGLEQIGQAAACYLGVPLMMADRVLGVMAVQSYTTPRLYDEHDQNLLTAIANQAAIAIQNARMFEQTQTRARREQLIREINARVSGSMDLETVLKTTARELSHALGASHAIIRLGAGATEPSLKNAPDGDNGDK